MTIKITSRKHEYEIEYANVMQLCGQNMIVKNEVIESLRKYFSNEKYQEYEHVNQASISIDGEECGRKAFEVYYIRDIRDIVSAIKVSKQSLMMQVLSQIIAQFESQTYMEQIDDCLINITNVINQQLTSIGGIMIDYSPNDIWEMVQKTEVRSVNSGECIENKTNYELLDIYINLLVQQQSHNPSRSLVILKDLDHLVDYESYYNLMGKISDIAVKYDVRFIISTSLPGYVFLEKGYNSGITVFNEFAYILPPLDKLNEFIETQYPCNKSFSEEQLRELLHPIIYRIGACGKGEFLGEVILAIINDSMLVRRRVKYGLPTNPEIAFLNGV